MTMEFGLQVSGLYEEVVAAARWAESRGFAAIALPDHYLMALDEERARTIPAPDGLAQLAGLARDTERIELVVLVSPVTFRHPAVLLKTAITIDRMSGGRFSLGIGTGWLDREHEVFGLPYPEIEVRYEMLEEALGYVRAGLDPSAPGFTGEHYRLEPFPIHPSPVGPVPLVVGGRGARRTPTLAGRYADEYNCYPAPPAQFAARLRRAREAAARAGRNPTALRISSSGQIVAAPTRAAYRKQIGEIADETGQTVEELEAAFDLRQTPRGTFDEVRGRLEALEALGCSRFYLQGRFDETPLERLLDGLALERR